LKNLIINIGKIILKISALTWRFEIIGSTPRKPAIVAFWHGLMLPVWKFFSYKDAAAIVSLSKDGQILSDILESWEIKLIRGSSHRGGKEALEALVESAKNNITLITPDGPRGPNRQFKAGAIVAAQRAEVHLFLCRVEIISKIILKKSWDKFQIPFPFSKIILNFSDKILIEKSADRNQIDSLLKELSERL
jgi:lysophospholipid acyltransferase (LPLAT)-like uncharacterized protein